MKRAINLFKTKKDYNKSFSKLPIISLSYIEEIDKCKCIVKNDFSQYVTFIAEEANSTIGLESLSSNQILEYSTDASTWTNMDTSTTIMLSNIDDEVYVRGVLSGDNTISNHTQFKMTGKIASSGNCNAIWNYQDLNAPLKSWCGYYMFSGCSSLTTAPELPATTLAVHCYNGMFDRCTSLTTAPELPSTTLADYCYHIMFSGCTSLTTVPELPATTLTSGCYSYMFEECTNLTTAPELPANELSYECYANMFRGCTSLTTAPELPATALYQSCYSGMFSNCTSLTTAPELPATELDFSCYRYMFQGCTSLNEIKCLAVDISAGYCTTDWVDGVAETGTFIKNPYMNDWVVDSVNGIPTGWTVINNGETPTPEPEEPGNSDSDDQGNSDVDLTTPYVTFRAEEDNSSIGLVELSTNQTLEYSTDTTTWNSFDITTNIPFNNGDKVYVRGVLSGNNSNSDYTQFEMTGKIAASGNCNAIWNYQDLDASLKQYCGFSMFQGCTALTTAPELPSTMLAECCYGLLFWGCTSLTKAPVLPATTLADYCYLSMFNGCTYLTQAPELPATTLASGCYQAMFNGCSSLTTAPKLPATTLAGSCYLNMFSGCKSLTTAPELPAITLYISCYSKMFMGCNSLNEIKCLATDISARDCTLNWVNGVAETGTFIKHPDMTDWTTGVNSIPEGWTVIDAETTPTPDPEEPGNSDSDDQGNSDVDLTTSYVTFTAQEDNSSIGLSCLSINQTLEYSTDTTTWNTFDTNTNIPLNNGDEVYVRGVLSKGVVIKNESDDGFSYPGEEVSEFKMTGKIASSGNCNALWNYQDLNAPLKIGCGLRLFANCTSLTTAPELPATTLAEYCYDSMFYGCTNLTTSPVLPATTLVKRCYDCMFSGCTALTQAPELPATTLASGCYKHMFSGCTGLTQAPVLPATTLASGCYESMFKGCSNLNYIKCLATDRSATDCTFNWVNGVASTGIFIKHPNTTSWPTGNLGVHGIPKGWTVINDETTPDPEV